MFNLKNPFPYLGRMVRCLVCRFFYPWVRCCCSKVKPNGKPNGKQECKSSCSGGVCNTIVPPPPKESKQAQDKHDQDNRSVAITGCVHPGGRARCQCPPNTCKDLFNDGRDAKMLLSILRANRSCMTYYELQEAAPMQHYRFVWAMQELTDSRLVLVLPIKETVNKVIVSVKYVVETRK